MVGYLTVSGFHIFILITPRAIYLSSFAIYFYQITKDDWWGVCMVGCQNITALAMCVFFCYIGFIFLLDYERRILLWAINIHVF